MSPKKKPKSTARKVVSARIKARIEEDDDDWVDADTVPRDDEPAPEEVEDEESSEDEAKEESASSSKRTSAREQAKTFFETISDGLRNAGETATRYTRIGVAHAEVEKLRYDLKAAHAQLGEAVMRCWADAPDLGLTSKDPGVAEATKAVRDVRRKIREREAKIAELKKDKPD